MQYKNLKKCANKIFIFVFANQCCKKIVANNMFELLFSWLYFIFAIIGVLVVLLFFATSICKDGNCVGTMEEDDDEDEDTKDANTDI